MVRVTSTRAVSVDGGPNGAFTLATTSRTWPGCTRSLGRSKPNVSRAALTTFRASRYERSNSLSNLWSNLASGVLSARRSASKVIWLQ
jgi:hypothetical protein